MGELFTKDSNVKGTIQGPHIKVRNRETRRNSRKFFFSHRVVKRWNSLDQEMVDASSAKAFKGRLAKTKTTML